LRLNAWNQILVHIFEHCPERFPHCDVFTQGRVTDRGNPLARREYVARQIATLLKFAKITRDPNVSAALIEKAADIKDRTDPLRDRSPQAPDVEPPSAS
jgi:hypothetical protein